MNIQHIINSRFNISKNVQNFKGKALSLPEISNDTFELSATDKKSGNVMKAKEIIVGDEAFRLYLASIDSDWHYEQLLGSEDDIDDIVIVFDNDKAIPLAQAKKMLEELKDTEIMEIKDFALDGCRPTLLIPKDWKTGWVEITKRDGRFYFRNTNPFKKVGFARKSNIEEAIRQNKASLATLSQRTAKDYWRTYCRNPEAYLEKNKKISLGNIKDIINSESVFVLPGAENKYVAFMPGIQKGIAALKDGESVIVGRRDKDDENNSQNKIIIPNDTASRAISRKHLLFENIDGELYVVDISKYGTINSSINASLYQSHYE